MRTFFITCAVLVVAPFLFHGCRVARLWPANDTGLFIDSPLPDGMGDSIFFEQTLAEIAEVRRCEAGLARLTDHAALHPALFRVPAAAAMDPDQKQELRLLWQSFLDYELALERIRLRHCSFWKIPLLSRDKSHALSFYAFYSAFLVQNISGSRLLRCVNNESQVEQFLNEPASGGLALAYSRLKFRVLNLFTFQTASTGYTHFSDFAHPALAGRDTPLLTWAAAWQEAAADTLLRLARERDLSLTLLNAPDIGRKQVFDLLFHSKKTSRTSWAGRITACQNGRAS
ncbi:MAG: hypothetical protein V1913_08285 [Fibrobacterota bacterium]